MEDARPSLGHKTVMVLPVNLHAGVRVLAQPTLQDVDTAGLRLAPGRGTLQNDCKIRLPTNKNISDQSKVTPRKDRTHLAALLARVVPAAAAGRDRILVLDLVKGLEVI